MDLGLAGCSALVGGASSGMGRATAATLAAEGARVVLFARRQAELDAAVAEINDTAGEERAVAVAGDASDRAALERAVDTAVERFGGLDILVNNTGGPPAGPFDGFDDTDWQAAFDLTVQSALRARGTPFPRCAAAAAAAS